MSFIVHLIYQFCSVDTFVSVYLNIIIFPNTNPPETIKYFCIVFRDKSLYKGGSFLVICNVY